MIASILTDAYICKLHLYILAGCSKQQTRNDRLFIAMRIVCHCLLKTFDVNFPVWHGPLSKVYFQKCTFERKLSSVSWPLVAESVSVRVVKCTFSCQCVTYISCKQLNPSWRRRERVVVRSVNWQFGLWRATLAFHSEYILLLMCCYYSKYLPLVGQDVAETSRFIFSSVCLSVCVCLCVCAITDNFRSETDTIW